MRLHSSWHYRPAAVKVVLPTINSGRMPVRIRQHPGGKVAFAAQITIIHPEFVREDGVLHRKVIIE
ncbi:MAG: hypothetical protein GY826_36940 [Fuerstiella sp.]|nr:hypothetical protein [Fuerstiella sp.]